MSANTEQRRHSLANFTIADPGASGAIPSDVSGICHIVTAAAESRTVATPLKAGLDLTLVLDTDGGDATVTAASAINMAGNTIMTFDNAGEIIVLRSVKVGTAYRWRVIANDGVSLS